MGKIEEKIKEELLKEANGQIDGLFDFLANRVEMEPAAIQKLIEQLNGLKTAVYDAVKGGKLP